MHDANLEERLRSVLRTEGDSLSLTITTDELERRLVLRRRARNGRRLSLMAAGIAVLAVGTMVALSNGWLRGTNVATDPSPSPTASAAPSPVTSAAPATSEPSARVADAVGSLDEAVLVTPVGVDSRRPDAFEVTRLHPATGESVAIATIPGSVLPEDGWLDSSEGPPQVSLTGWLAIPFTRGPNEDEQGPAIAIVDTRAPDAEPWILDGYTSMSWDPADKLVVERDGVVSIAWPMSRFLEPFGAVGAASRIVYEGNWVASGPAITTEDFTRFLATRVEDEAWGYVGFDGAFTPTTDLPPVYQRTGRERLAGADAHGLGDACDSGGTPAASGCWLVETDADHVPVATWLDLSETSVYDFAWTVDGKSVWMLLDGGTAGGSQVATLSYARDVDTRVERARIDVTDGVRPQILGFGEELSPGSETVVAIGDEQGRIHAFVLEGGDVVTHDGTAWFAGWAADPAPYDPD